MKIENTFITPRPIIYTIKREEVLKNLLKQGC